ncbi:MAG: hypothetical protein IKW80_07875 [Thermoguttaceae bacterium]|nr:hypothetical protein [Thermoguttaceae bacterium]
MSDICYLGDDSINSAAMYLIGIMTHFNLSFDRVDSSDSPDESFIQKPYKLYIISDYPRERFSDAQLQYIADAVKAGAGLLMIGGWESYYGRLGEYHKTVLTDVLPVEMLQEDDRRNYSQPCVITPCADHPITAGLPWNTPPCIGGFNEYKPKPTGQTIMKIHRFAINQSNDQFEFSPIEDKPLLVVGTYGAGNTAALATDAAPHWVGGFVDWGTQRCIQDLPNGGFIDVGADYAQFFKQLIEWTMQK